MIVQHLPTPMRVRLMELCCIRKLLVCIVC
jgi:hypothetical protein